MKTTVGASLVSTSSNSLGIRNKESHQETTMTLSYATTFCPRPNRPTMISAKYRQKEERRKVLKISINKLKKIEDPESSLRRSVLINNTMKRLQKEAREEKMQKQERVKDDILRDQQLADITNLPKKEEIDVDSRRKRPLEEEEGEDVQSVLSQFYMPLTPRMLTAMDEDDEVNVVDVDVEATGSKRPRTEPSFPLSDQPAPFSCGHLSMFTELQSVVYHSLITSLET